MVLFRITENEPSKMHNVRPYVYSRPWLHILDLNKVTSLLKNLQLFRVESVVFNRPIYVGFCVLDLSKLHMIFTITT